MYGKINKDLASSCKIIFISDFGGGPRRMDDLEIFSGERFFFLSLGAVGIVSKIREMNLSFFPCAMSVGQV